MVSVVTSCTSSADAFGHRKAVPRSDVNKVDRAPSQQIGGEQGGIFAALLPSVGDQRVGGRVGQLVEPAVQRGGRRLGVEPGGDALVAEEALQVRDVNTERRLAAWAGVAPGNYESAGKPKGAGTRRGNVFLESALFAAASAAVRTKGSYYRDKYNRLRARHGPVRAIMAMPTSCSSPRSTC